MISLTSAPLEIIVLALLFETRQLALMFEVNWGKPLVIAVTTEGDTKKISTIEHAQYLLSRKWPVDDVARRNALSAIDDAMECMGSVTSARVAFLQAAQSAGFQPAAASFA